MADEYITKEQARTLILNNITLTPVQWSNIKKQIGALPAADVRPVGRWLTKEYMYGDKSVGIDDYWIDRLAEDSDYYAYCSKCGKDAGYNGDGELVLSAYCPNCGADMRPSEEPESLTYITPEERGGVDDG